jgi:hypothetical protein
MKPQYLLTPNTSTSSLDKLLSELGWSTLLPLIPLHPNPSKLIPPLKTLLLQWHPPQQDDPQVRLPIYASDRWQQSTHCHNKSSLWIQTICACQGTGPQPFSLSLSLSLLYIRVSNALNPHPFVPQTKTVTPDTQSSIIAELQISFTFLHLLGTLHFTPGHQVSKPPFFFVLAEWSRQAQTLIHSQHQRSVVFLFHFSQHCSPPHHGNNNLLNLEWRFSPKEMLRWQAHYQPFYGLQGQGPGWRWWLTYDPRV